MSFLPIILLALAGVFAWLASKNPAASTPSESEDGGFDIGQIGGDTVQADKAKEFEQLRSLGQDLINWGGGSVVVKSPDYLLELNTASEAVQFQVPVHTTAVLDQYGEYVPADAIYLSTYGGTKTPYLVNRAFMKPPAAVQFSDKQVSGYIDFYASPTPGERKFYVFREKGTPMPAFGYTLGGTLALPACFRVDASTGQLYYDAAKDAGGVWFQKTRNTDMSWIEETSTP